MGLLWPVSIGRESSNVPSAEESIASELVAATQILRTEQDTVSTCRYEAMRHNGS